MELMEGDVDSLVSSEEDGYGRTIAAQVLHEMLQALDYLNRLGYVHRDVKPCNILYCLGPRDTTAPHRQLYHFKLGDFGLCCCENSIPEVIATRIFTAPELFASPRVHEQSHKSDVWALYVTILWMLDRHKFQGLSEASGTSILHAVRWAGSNDEVYPLQEMARADPAERASAAQMLVKLF